MSTSTVYLVDREDNDSSKREDPINIISKLIGIPRGREWSVTSEDKEKQLYMIHYSEELASMNRLDMESYGHIRGLVVDVGYGVISCKSSGYQIETVQDELTVTSDGQMFKFEQKDGSIFTTPISETTLNKGYEGVQLRIWKDSYGDAHISTFKKLDLSKSMSRGISPLYFHQYYEMLGGPAPESFFDPEKKYSPYVHIVMLVHTDLLTVSRQLIDTKCGGYLVYLGNKRMDVQYDVDETEDSPYKVKTYDNIVDASDNDGLYNPEPLTIEGANDYLKYGYYVESDVLKAELSPGEFIFASWKDMEFRILSSGYNWRLQLCPDGNRLRNFCIAALQSRVSSTFGTKFPAIPLQNIEQLNNIVSDGYPILKLTDGKVLNSPSISQRLINAHICFLMAVPLHAQEEAMKYMKKYTELIRNACKTIYTIRKTDTSSYRIDRSVLKYINGMSASNYEEIERTLYKIEPTLCFKICKNLEKAKHNRSVKVV